MPDDTVTTPPWIASLPDDLKNNPSITAFKGNTWDEVGPTVLKSFIETKALTGRKAYSVPADDWKPEQWAEWNKTIGVPDAPDKYPTPDAAMAEKAGMSKETLDAAFKKFHEIGMTPRQVKSLLNDWYIGEAAKGADMAEQQRKAQTEQATTTLKQEFGDKYEAKMGLVKAFLSKFGSPELIKWADESGAGNSPEFVKALVKASEAMLEDSSHGGRAGQFGPASSKASALQAISELKMDKGFMQQFMSGQKDAVKKWNDLHQVAYSSTQ